MDQTPRQRSTQAQTVLARALDSGANEKMSLKPKMLGITLDFNVFHGREPVVRGVYGLLKFKSRPDSFIERLEDYEVGSKCLFNKHERVWVVQVDTDDCRVAYRMLREDYATSLEDGLWRRSLFSFADGSFHQTGRH